MVWIGKARTNKGENTRGQSDKKGKTGGAPTTSIVKCGKDVGWRAMRSKVDQWNQNAEEADNMDDENDGFNPRQHTNQVCVDK